MNNNFRELNEFLIFDESDQDEVFRLIEYMENKIKENDLENVGNQIRKIVEQIFVSTPKIDSDGNLSEKIRNVDLYIPTNVRDGLFSLRNISNRESHIQGSYRRSTKTYKVNISVSEANVALRNIWLFIKWIGIEIKGIDKLKEYQYNDSQVSNFVDKNINNDLSNVNDDFAPEKFTIAQLIFSSKYSFNIPTYQRDYTWSKNNIDKLMDDIYSRTIDNKTHYFGSMAIAIEKSENILRIIDGQQRITTSLLLLKAFYEEFKRRNLVIPSELETFVAEKLKNIYVNQEVLSSQKAVSLLLRGGVYTFEYNKLPFDNWNQINDFLSTKPDDKIIEMYSSFSTKFEITTLIFKTDIENEMDIFENLNTGGTKLSNWDLIRSYIFSRVEPSEFRLNEKKIDQILMRKIITPLSIATKNNYHKQLDVFFNIYNRYKFSVDMRQNADSESYKNFKMSWPKSDTKFTSIQEFQEELNDIEMIYNCYMELIYWYKENDSKLHGYAYIIKLINRDDFIPILIHEMLMSCKFDSDKKLKSVSKSFIKVMRIIESFFMRAPVYGNNQKKIVDTFLSIHSENVVDNLMPYLKEKSPLKMMTMEEFKEHVKTHANWQKSQIMNMLMHMELKLRNVPFGHSGLIVFEDTHEHILAQKLNYKDYDDQTISEEHFTEIRNSRKDSLGNALILTRGDNSSAGNKPFSNKKAIYKKSSYLAKGSNDDVKIMNLLNKSRFTFDDVNLRAEELGEFLVENKFYFDE